MGLYFVYLMPDAARNFQSNKKRPNRPNRHTDEYTLEHLIKAVLSEDHYGGTTEKFICAETHYQKGEILNINK